MELNRIVNMYFDYAEDQAKRHRQIFMSDWREKLDAFIQFNERDVLTNAGVVTKDIADKLAVEQYDIYSQQRLADATRAEAVFDDEELKKIIGDIEDDSKV